MLKFAGKLIQIGIRRHVDEYLWWARVVCILHSHQLEIQLILKILSLFLFILSIQPFAHLLVRLFIHFDSCNHVHPMCNYLSTCFTSLHITSATHSTMCHCHFEWVWVCVVLTWTLLHQFAMQINETWILEWSLQYTFQSEFCQKSHWIFSGRLD